MKELTQIQAELKAPKSQYNNFGKYNYRSLEDICEALKPIMLKYECNLIMSDEIVLIGDRYYVKSVATLTNKDGIIVQNAAYAREPENKKGMDVSQITGASSSYCRKYALNGLFCIDDTKDADVTNTHGFHDKVQKTFEGTKVSPLDFIKKHSKLVAICKEKKLHKSDIESAVVDGKYDAEKIEAILREI